MKAFVRRHWTTHPWRLLSGGAVIGLALVTALAHSGVARARVLTWGLSQLRAFGIEASADRLDYNLFTFSAGVEHVSLSAPGSEVPFFTADALRIDLPWSVVTGALAVESLEIDRPRVAVVQREDGSSNLPRFPESDAPADGSAPLERVRIDRLVVRSLDVQYADAAIPLSVDGRGVTLDSSRGPAGTLAGRLTMADGVRLRVGERETTVATLDGNFGFDGSTVSVDALRLVAPETELRFDGSVTVLADAQRIDMRYEGALDAERSAPWIPIEPAPTGRITVSGTVTGPLATPDVTFALAGDGLAWSTLGSVGFDARGAMSGSMLSVDTLQARLAGGELSGEARFDLERRGESRVSVRVANVDVATLATLAPDLPAQVAARGTGEMAVEWVAQDLASARGTLSMQFRAPSVPPNAIDLAGRLDLQLDRGSWTAVVDQQLAERVTIRGEAAGQLLSDDLARSALTGAVRLEVESLQPVLARLRAAGLAIDDRVSTAARGTLSLTADLSGTFGAPQAQGTLEASDVWFDVTGPAVAHASFDATTRLVTIDPVRLDLGADSLGASLSLDLTDNALQGRVTATLPDLALLARYLPPEYQPTGAASLDGRLGGQLANPSIDLTVSLRDVRVAGQSLATIEARVRYADRAVAVDTLDLTQAEGRLSVTGRYELDGNRYSFDAVGNDLTVAPILTRADAAADSAAEPPTVPVEGRFNLALRGEGTVAAPRATGFVQFSQLDWGQYRLGALRAELTADGGTALLRANMPSTNATVQASVDLTDSRAFTVSATVDTARLSDLVRPTGPAGTLALDARPTVDPAAVAGSITARLTGRGQWDALGEATTEIELRLLDAAINGAPVRLERPARLRYASNAIVAEDFELHIGPTSIVVAEGALATTAGTSEGLTVRLTGQLADFVPLIRLSPAAGAFDASGAIDLRLHAGGALDLPELSAELSVAAGSATDGTLPSVRDVTLAATYANGLVELASLGASWQGASLTASGRLPAVVLGDWLPERYRQSLPPYDGVARVTARLDSVTPQAVAPFVDQDTLAQVSGRMDARLEMETRSLELDAIQGEVSFERAELELARVPLGQTRPTRLRLANGRLDVVDWNWEGAGNHFDVTGGVTLGGTPRLGFGLRGTLDLRALGAFVPDVATGGRGSLDIRVTGELDDPIVEGTLTLADGEVIVRDPRVALTDIDGTVTLARDRALVNNVTASANGGTLQVQGNVEYSALTVSGGALSIVGRGLAFDVPEGLRTEVDTDLQLSLSSEAPSLSGRVTILRGSYREPISLAGQLLTGVQVVAAVPEEIEPSLADRIQLGIAVVSEQDILVDNNYGRLELGSNLRVVGTVTQPVLAGRLTIQEGGQVFLGGRNYEVRRGTVDFTNPTRIEPDIDLAVETRVQQYDITLEVRGTPDTLEAELRSPGISQQDVVSLLLTGQVADETTTIAQEEIARGQLVMLLSGELLGFAGRAVGLDSVQVSRGLGSATSNFDLLSTDTDPSARLTITKNLSRDVEVVYSQSLRESGNITWVAIYRPIRNVELRGTTQDDNSRAYEFRHQVDFGDGLALRTGREQRTAAEEARVTAIHFEGTPGFSDAVLLDVTRLKVGNRFDFYEWQGDHDRLAAFYHARDFLEARVSARREANERDNTVTLEYRIERGPITVLAIEGAQLSGGVIDRMQRMWGEAVFDGFLLEDLETIARRALVEQAHPRAEVKASVNVAPERTTKTITVSIVPGPRYGSRRLAFSGNQRVPAGELDALATARGLDVTAWLTPRDLESAIEQHYRALGYLTADATIEPAVFNGDTATLPVRVDEGPQFRIAGVEIRGASARSEQDVRSAFDIRPESAYVPAAIEPARREVEVGYLREGFNDARVAVTSVVDRERARVDLSLNVHEGPRQVLVDVETRGAEVTSRGTINRALDLETGTAANLTDYYRAQKRLYDTGVFQRADVELQPVEGVELTDTGDQPVRAMVTLQELPRYRFRYGIRLNDETGPAEVGREVRPAFVVDLLRRNLFGRAISTGVAGQIEGDRRLGRGFISLPRLLGVPLVTNLFLTASRRDFSPEGALPFVEDTSEITLEQRFKPARRMAVTYGYAFGRNHVFEPDPVPDLIPLDIIVKVARLTGTYAWDTRDDPSNARRGWFHSSGLEYGPEALGSDLRFIRYLAQQYYFKSIGREIVLGSGFRAGFGRGFGQDLISSERFYAGGGTTVRGFAEGGLGERNFFGDPVGGNGLLLLNQEIRFPIFKWVRGVGFLDAGNVFRNAGDFSFTDLEAGTGVGLRVHSPFALIRLDFGIPLTRRDRERSGRWYLGLGQTF